MEAPSSQSLLSRRALLKRAGALATAGSLWTLAGSRWATVARAADDGAAKALETFDALVASIGPASVAGIGRDDRVRLFDAWLKTADAESTFPVTWALATVTSDLAPGEFAALDGSARRTYLESRYNTAAGAGAEPGRVVDPPSSEVVRARAMSSDDSDCLIPAAGRPAGPRATGAPALGKVSMTRAQKVAAAASTAPALSAWVPGDLDAADLVRA